VFASDFWAGLQTNMVINQNDEVGSKADTNLKLQAGWKYVYLWGSMDSGNSMEWGGQPGPEYKVSAVGAGLRIPVFEYLAVYGEFGRFFMGGQDKGWQAMGGQNSWEGIYMDMNKHFPGRDGFFDNYRNTFYDAWGGEIGVQAYYPVWTHVDLTAQFGYRILGVEYKQQAIDGCVHEGTPNWQFHNSMDLNAWVVGVGLKINF
jgi:hypothetical protein